MIALPEATIKRLLAFLQDTDTNMARELANEVQTEARAVEEKPQAQTSPVKGVK
jgi:hypothetical protein